MTDNIRHKSIFDPFSFHHPVHIIGCGGIGSRVAESITRMGVGIINQSPIHLYDFDRFEYHNIANQWADIGDVGSLKVRQVALSMRGLNLDCNVSTYNKRVKWWIPLSGVVFICVDSMEARREIMEQVVEENPEVVCVIETRMDAETAISHCFNPHNKQQSDCWWLYWNTDAEADNIGGCNQPQSIFSAIIGTTALAIKQFEQFARMDHTYGMENRVYFDFPTFTCKSERWPHLTEG
jgi:molybdopterin/thiamine biosynthesis adenylyltransferase